MTTREAQPRAEHLLWCKERALALLADGERLQAFASMISDLGKHPETREHLGIELGSQLLLAGHLASEDQMRQFIEGFN